MCYNLNCARLIFDKEKAKCKRSCNVFDYINKCHKNCPNFIHKWAKLPEYLIIKKEEHGNAE